MASYQLPPEQYHAHVQTPTLKNIKLRYGSLQQFFDALGADIVCLQETKLSSAAVTRELACIPGYESFWSSSRVKLGYSGCVTFVKLQYAASAAVTDHNFDGATCIAPT
jgi:exonuclease III